MSQVPSRTDSKDRFQFPGCGDSEAIDNEAILVPGLNDLKKSDTAESDVPEREETTRQPSLSKEESTRQPSLSEEETTRQPSLSEEESTQQPSLSEEESTQQPSLSESDEESEDAPDSSDSPSIQANGFESTKLIEAMPSDGDTIDADNPSSSLVMRFGKAEATELSQNYTVGEQIGRGASGKVYEAWRKADNKHVVIKVLITESLGDDNETNIAIKRFYREAELISSLHEKHIVECVDYGRYHGTPCMVLEYIDGLSLDQLIIKYGALPLSYATGVIEQLLEALVETHSKGIIHRDIKPSNIMVFDAPPPYEIRVLDFGISTVLEGLQSQTLMTQAGNVRGTPSYMAPELFTGETRASVESDLYAVGLCYYECLTGLVAFNDKSFMRVAYKQVNEALEVPGYIPEGIANIILKLCEKPIRLRYHSAQEVLDDIHANIDKALEEEDKCLEKWKKDKKPVKRHSTALITSEGPSNFKFIVIGAIIIILAIIGVIIYLNVLIAQKPSVDPLTDHAAPQPVQAANSEEGDLHEKTQNSIRICSVKLESAFNVASIKYDNEVTKAQEAQAEEANKKTNANKKSGKSHNKAKSGKTNADSTYRPSFLGK